MADDQAKLKLQRLAGRVQGRITTLNEDARLEQVIRAKQIRTRQDVRDVLGEALGKNSSDVVFALANHDDSDRLIDDIINEIKK